MNLPVLLLNKTTLKKLQNGATGPILNAFKATPAELIYELENASPTPKFRSGNKELTVEFLNELITYHSEAQASVNAETPRAVENTVTNNVPNNNSNNFKNKKNNYKNNNQNTADKAAESNTEADAAETSETEETSTTN